MKAALKTEKHSVKDLFSFVESKGQRGVEFGLLVCLLAFNDYVMSDFFN